MSMLSAQCDELRSMAESVGLAMPQAATLMMDAADTIWELRCKCAGMVDMRERARLAEVENERLWQENRDVGMAAYELGRKSMAGENAKLRELALDLYCLAYPSTVEWEVADETYDKYSPCEKCHELHGGKSPCASTAKDMTEECCAPIQANVVADCLRELGIEVDG